MNDSSVQVNSRGECGGDSCRCAARAAELRGRGLSLERDPCGAGGWGLRIEGSPDSERPLRCGEGGRRLPCGGWERPDFADVHRAEQSRSIRAAAAGKPRHFRATWTPERGALRTVLSAAPGERCPVEREDVRRRWYRCHYGAGHAVECAFGGPRLSEPEKSRLRALAAAYPTGLPPRPVDRRLEDRGLCEPLSGLTVPTPRGRELPGPSQSASLLKRESAEAAGARLRGTGPGALPAGALERLRALVASGLEGLDPDAAADAPLLARGFLTPLPSTGRVCASARALRALDAAPLE